MTDMMKDMPSVLSRPVHLPSDSDDGDDWSEVMSSTSSTDADRATEDKTPDHHEIERLQQQHIQDIKALEGELDQVKGQLRAAYRRAVCSEDDHARMVKELKAEVYCLEKKLSQSNENLNTAIMSVESSNEKISHGVEVKEESNSTARKAANFVYRKLPP